MTISSDQLHRFTIDNADIRGVIVTLDQCLSDMPAMANYPAIVQALLGEFMAATSLLSSTLKFDGILTLQARGNGDLPIIMGEMSHQKKLRGIAQVTQDKHLSEGRNLASLLGEGVLSMTIDPDKGERYQGIVPLEGDQLATCLEGYFQHSEQLPTRIWLASDGKKASGLLIQSLPQQLASAEHNQDTWATLVHLASTITQQELLALNHPTLLTRLFHELGVRLYEPELLSFGCSCSKERCSNTLKHAGQDELQTILSEDGQISVDCHFCGFQYIYNQNDVEALFLPETRH